MNIRKYIHDDELGLVNMLREEFPKIFAAYIFDRTSGNWYCRLDEIGPFLIDLNQEHSRACSMALYNAFTQAIAEEEAKASISGTMEDKEVKMLLNSLRACKHYCTSVAGRAKIMAMAIQGEKNSMSFAGGTAWHDKPNEIPLRKVIVTLKKGIVNVRPHNKADYIKSFIELDTYDPQAKCPKFLQFLRQIFLGDEDIIHFLQVLFGYALLRNGREHISLFLAGEGNRGKSTLINIIFRVFDTLAVDLQKETILSSKNKASSGSIAKPDILALQGKALYIAKETDEGCVLDSGIVKNIVSKDPISARGLYSKNITTFVPQGLLCLCTNFKPHINPNDLGIVRRILSVPFNAVFTDNPSGPNEFKKNIDIEEEIIEEEKPGIFHWLITGAKEWQDKGLPPVPKAMMDSKQEYLNEEDSIRDFIDECCIVYEDPLNIVGTSKTILHACYIDWAKARGEKPMKYRTFRKRLIDKGFKEERTERARFFTGIQIDSEMALIYKELAQGKVPGEHNEYTSEYINLIANVKVKKESIINRENNQIIVDKDVSWLKPESLWPDYNEWDFKYPI